MSAATTSPTSTGESVATNPAAPSLGRDERREPGLAWAPWLTWPFPMLVRAWLLPAFDAALEKAGEVADGEVAPALCATAAEDVSQATHPPLLLIVVVSAAGPAPTVSKVTPGARLN